MSVGNKFNHLKLMSRHVVTVWTSTAEIGEYLLKDMWSLFGPQPQKLENIY
jgi:hypothetical protein